MAPIHNDMLSLTSTAYGGRPSLVPAYTGSSWGTSDVPKLPNCVFASPVQPTTSPTQQSHWTSQFGEPSDASLSFHPDGSPIVDEPIPLTSISPTTTTFAAGPYHADPSMTTAPWPDSEKLLSYGTGQHSISFDSDGTPIVNDDKRPPLAVSITPTTSTTKEGSLTSPIPIQTPEVDWNALIDRNPQTTDVPSLEGTETQTGARSRRLQQQPSATTPQSLDRVRGMYVRTSASRPSETPTDIATTPSRGPGDTTTTPTSSGGLGPGAIAGVAVGSVAAAAGLTWLMVRQCVPSKGGEPGQMTYPLEFRYPEGRRGLERRPGVRGVFDFQSRGGV